MIKERKYIHNYESQYASCKKRLNSLKISKRNKELISKFENDCFLKDGIEIPTRLKYYDVLINVALKYVKKDFDKLTKEDYEEIITQLESREEITISTKQKYKSIIKKFGRWLAYGDKIFSSEVKEYPDTVSWINTHIKAKNRPKIRASEILTEEEIDSLIESTDHPRNKAFLSILYETGSRMGELGNIKIKDLTEHEHGFLIDLARGKTGERNVIVVFSSSKLVNWLNQHPDKDNKNAYVWVSLLDDKSNDKQRGTPLDYRGLYKIVERAKLKAGIKKRTYPHLFRHSRVTHLLMNKQINESQAKVYFGWVPSSDMLSNYSHITSRDVNNTMLEINGLKPSEKIDGKRAKICSNCQKPNDTQDSFCGYCAKPLDFKTLMDVESKAKRGASVIDKATEKKIPITREDLKVLIQDMAENGEIKL